MARWKHHVRKGNGAADRRDLQVNGRPRISEDWDITGSSFYKAPPGYYTGFAADGRWYELGIAVTDALTETLGSDLQPLNSRKWALSGDFTWQQEAGALLIQAPADTPGTETFAMRSPTNVPRWHLRGDFLIRLRVTDCDIAEGAQDGVDGADNALWLGVWRLTSTATAWRVKRYRAKTFNGFAVEVADPGGAANFVGEVQKAIGTFTLVLRRHAGALTASYINDQGAVTDLWGPVAWPGIAVVEIGARNAGSAAWSARLLEFQHELGRHTYSARASWWREAATGAVFDDFWGDELDPQLWTASSTGTGSVAMQPGVDDAPGTGVRLSAPAVGDEALLTFRHVTGDHTVTVDFTFPDTVAGTNDAPDTDVILRLLVESSIARPALYLEVVVDGSQKLHVRAVQLPDAGPGVVLAMQELERVAGVNVYRFVIERRGPIFRLQAVDAGQGFAVDVTDEASMPSVPVAYKLRSIVFSSLGSVQADVRAFRLTTPNALTLAAWPDRAYAATTKAAAEEVVTTAADPDCTLGEVTLIDVGTRVPVWRVVSGGNGTDADPGLQALPQGEIWDPFFDAETGRLWVPVRPPEHPTAGAWVCFDLRHDVVRAKLQAGNFWFAPDLPLTPAAGTAVPIAYRQIGIGYDGPELLQDEVVLTGTPPTGLPIRYETFALDNGHVWHVWATRTAGVLLRRWNGAAWSEITVLVPFLHELPALHRPTTINRVAVVPGTATRPSQLVATAAIRTDLCVVVYRDLDAVLAFAGPLHGADGAAAAYTRPDHDANWAGDVPTATPKLFPDGSAGGQDVDAFVSASHAADGADGLCLIAVPQQFAVTLLQEAGDPADTAATYWQRQSEGIPQTAPLVITGEPRSVRLTRDADLDTSPPRGFLAVQEQGSAGGAAGENARVQIISLARQTVRYTLQPTDVDAAEFAGVSPEGEAIRIIEAPPDTAVGARLVWTYEDPPGAVVEWDLWSLDQGTSGGPHIGGGRVEARGWGLEGTREVRVGGRPCFRLQVTTDPAGGPAKLRAVTRALAFVEHPDEQSPVMPDAELEAKAEWPHDVEIVANDGAVIVLPGGFTYVSNLCIERTLRRLMARIPLPEQEMDTDPKANHWQRHIWIALAWLICRYRSDFATKLERDSYRAEAIGPGLQAWAASYAAGRPYDGMSDDQLRAYALARAFGSRITRRAVADMMEAVLGYRPKITEGYREFTVWIDPASVTNANLWGAVGDAAPLETAFFRRDFWHGEAAIAAARAVLDFCRAAGVRARVNVEPT